MKGAFRKTLEDVVVKDCELWDLEEDEIRLRVKACGICGTDVSFAKAGDADYKMFGHEVAGTVVAVGSRVRNLRVGQNVLLESASACGKCANCRNTLQELCSDVKSFFFKTSFGVAQEMISPAISAIPYEGVSEEEACMTEPLGVAVDMHRLADIRHDSVVVVSGLGPIGLMALRLARLSGARRIYACDLSNSRIRLEAARAQGADEIIEVDRTPIEEVKFDSPPDRFMVSSPPFTLPPMFKVAAKGAVISYIGIAHGDSANITFNADQFHFKKLQLRASFASPALYTPAALDLIRSKQVDALSLISHRFELDQAGEALKTAADASASLKVIVHP